MKNCINCNNSIDDNARFCNVCGANQELAGNDQFVDLDKTVSVYDDAPMPPVMPQPEPAPIVQPQESFAPPVPAEPYVAPKQNADFDPDATVGAYSDAPVIEPVATPEYEQPSYVAPPQQPAYTPDYNQYQQPPVTQAPKKKKGGAPWWVVLLIIVLCLGVLGFGGWYVYDNYIADNDSSQSDKDDEKEKETEEPTEEETEEPTEEETEEPTEEPTKAPSYSYTRGSVYDDVYTNNWANIMVDLNDWQEASASEYAEVESDVIDCGVYLRDEEKGYLIITFEKLPSSNKDVPDEEYLRILMDGIEDNYDDSELGDIKPETIAGEQYVSQTVTFNAGTLAQKVCVRILDGYAIRIMATSYNEADASAIINEVKACS